jgi:hypothetical protein
VCQQLQDLINCFVAYCDRHGLTVNPSKCEVVVFAKNCRAWTGFGDWKVKDKALPRSSISVSSYTMSLAPRTQLSIA